MFFRALTAGALALALAGPALAADVTVEQPWARAAMQGGVGGAFMVVKNAGTTPDRLLSASSPVAGKVEIHSTIRDGDVMRMRPATDGIAVPAGGTVTLAPGGYHVMLMGLTKALAAGESVPITLTFEKAGAVPVEAKVQAAGAMGAGMQHGTMRH